MKITIHRSGTNYGPYSLQQANSLLASGQLAPDDLAWIEGSPEWTPLADVPGILEVPPAPRRQAHSGSDKRILPAFLLAFFVGVFGIHRFYVGKTGSGVAMLVLTLTLIGAVVTAIWATIDWIIIVCGGFTDGQGQAITQWT